MQPWVSGALQAKPFFFATTKNRIGRGPRRCCYDHCRRNHSSLQQQKLESDAEDRCRDDCCRRNHSPLRQRRLESDAEDCCRDDRCRRNHSSLPLRKLESVAEVRCRDGRFRRAIPHCCDDGAAVIPKFTLSNQESLQCKMRFQAKSCIDSQVWPRNQESKYTLGSFRGKPCIDSQVWA